MLVYNNDNNTNDNDNDNDDIYRRPPLQALGRRKGPTKTIESNDELHIVYIYIYQHISAISQHDDSCSKHRLYMCYAVINIIIYLLIGRERTSSLGFRL